MAGSMSQGSGGRDGEQYERARTKDCDNMIYYTRVSTFNEWRTKFCFNEVD